MRQDIYKINHRRFFYYCYSLEEQINGVTPGEEPLDYMYDYYIVPWTRCPVYFMGILLGYLFHKTEGKIKMPKVKLRFIIIPHLISSNRLLFIYVGLKHP